MPVMFAKHTVTVRRDGKKVRVHNKPFMFTDDEVSQLLTAHPTCLRRANAAELPEPEVTSEIEQEEDDAGLNKTTPARPALRRKPPAPTADDEEL